MANELKHGSVGTILTSDEYHSITAHITNDQVRGDLLRSTSSANGFERIALGASGALLKSDGTDPIWTAALLDASERLKHEYGGIEADISAITTGGILRGTGAGTMGILAAFLDSSGRVTHEYGGIEADISAITTGGILYGTTAGTMGILPIGSTSQVLTVSGGTTAWTTLTSDLYSILQDVVENATRVCFAFAGGASNTAGPTDGEAFGIGWTVQEGSGASVSGIGGTAGVEGFINCSSGTTADQNAALQGPVLVPTNDPSCFGRCAFSTAAALKTGTFGWTTTSDVADANNRIAWRVLTTGTVIGVCDSGGTETTRDTSITPGPAVPLRLGIVVSAGGTIVQFRNADAQVGTNVTTNIPTGTLGLVAGIENNTTTAVLLRCADLVAWQEDSA